LRNDDNHAFQVLTAEPVRGSMPRAGLIRALFGKLRSFKIKRPVNDFILITGAMNFCPEPEDIPGGGQHQSTVRHYPPVCASVSEELSCSYEFLRRLALAAHKGMPDFRDSIYGQFTVYLRQ
jgi:hypothetical protein